MRKGAKNEQPFGDRRKLRTATFPKAVVVVVAAALTPFKALLKNFRGSTADPLTVASFMVSGCPGMSEELR
jgi:hypothetical protein